MKAAHSFIAGGGEMGERIRALDWSKNLLGPIDGWPQSLRSAVSILLPSKAQIALCWGEQFITLYNDAYKPVFGAKHPEALGLPISQAWDELWPAGLKEMFEGVVSSGDAYWARDQPFFMERHGYLEETFFDVSYDPVRDESGRVGGLFCIVSETTGRVVGERRMRTLRDLARAVQDASTVGEVHRVAAVALAQSQPDIAFALLYGRGNGGNQELMAATGLALPHAAAPGSLPPSDGSAWPTPDLMVVLEREQVGNILAGPWPEPLKQVAVIPIADTAIDDPLGHLVVGINARRRFDDDYRDFLQLIASIIASAINSARRSEDEHRRAESLAELDRAKTTFFTNISHEFRTPLTLLLSPIEEALKLGALDGEDLQLAYRNGRRLLRLVNGLLDFARIQAGRLKAQFVAVDLPRMTHELVSLFRSAAERSGLSLSIEADAMRSPVYIDRDMYEKIVSNLLSNAIKFTRSGGIAVSLRDHDDRVELVVSDTGVGIAQAELPRLFERFHRIGNSWSRTQEGSGIGLALLHDLVALLGGSVEARSVLGQGSTFTVTLPRSAAPSAEAFAAADFRLGSHGIALAEEAARWRHGEGTVELLQSSFNEVDRAEPSAERIIVVDDNEDVRTYLTRLLGERWQVQALGDGMQALEVAAQWAPDLIVTDVMMPQLDGFGLLAALRKAPATRSTPVMLVSARAGEEARIDALRAGADDYVVKPFSARELVARVESLLLKGKLRAAERDQGDRLNEVFAQAPVGIAVFQGPEHRFEFVNDAYLELVNRRPVQGLPIRQALPELEGQGIYELLDDVYASGIRFHGRSVRLMVLDAGGVPRERYFEFVYQPTRGSDNRSKGIVVVVYEVTALTEARREADRANRAKDDFLAMLGHELRNPLAPIVTALHVMRLSGADAFQKERAIIERQTDHLVRLVDDLLDVSRIASGKVELRKERLDLRQAIGIAVETASPALERQRQVFETDLASQPLWVHGDAARLAQVISNLLVNASKYTPPGGHIRIAAHARGDVVELKVTDDGVGISAENLPLVFDQFMQERQAVDRAAGGLGLGLTIVKSLVLAHGGEVHASSAGKSQGSEFTVRLPLLQTELGASSRARDAVPSADGRRRRVLLVDDNLDAAETLAMVLELHGFETCVEPDGPRALESAADFKPDVAVLDIGLPVMDGNELARHLKRSQPDLCIVALTGYGTHAVDDSTGDCFKARLLKPVELLTLLAAIAPDAPAA